MNSINRQSDRARLFVLTCLACVVALGATPKADAAMINFSSLEVNLVDPNDKMAVMRAAWADWKTQLYEYNMPFIELTNPASASEPIDTFQMTIGDTDYNFGTNFQNKQWTNSLLQPATGEPAVLGYSTPNVDISSQVINNGDALLVVFGSGGLQPGETVRFQVDINRDDATSGAMLFADYTSVFFSSNGGPNISGNSQVAVTYTGSALPSIGTLPNQLINFSTQTPRVYSVMQPVPVFPAFPLNVIPEPSAALLALVFVGVGAARRR